MNFLSPEEPIKKGYSPLSASYRNSPWKLCVGWTIVKTTIKYCTTFPFIKRGFIKIHAITRKSLVTDWFKSEKLIDTINFYIFIYKPLHLLKPKICTFNSFEIEMNENMKVSYDNSKRKLNWIQQRDTNPRIPRNKWFTYALCSHASAKCN